MIDLYSDTLTKPSPAMRRAMAEAEVGDEQRREDPSTNRLQAMVAELLGKEAAVFLPSGSMCNAVAIKAHTQPGELVLCDRLAHVYRSEFGSHAMLSSVTTEGIDGERGRFTRQQLEAALKLDRSNSWVYYNLGLLYLEQRNWQPALDNFEASLNGTLKPSWIGWSWPSEAIPSMVVTARPSAWTASIVQDFTVLPSTSTVHDPQVDVSQPTFVPVRPSCSRMKYTSSWRGSTSASREVPLTVTEIRGMQPPSP